MCVCVWGGGGGANKCKESVRKKGGGGVKNPLKRCEIIFEQPHIYF